MGRDLPMALDQLLAARDQPTRDAAWDRLIAEHSDLLLRVARSIGGSHDAVMDRYAHALDHLRRDDFRKLRAYVPTDDAQFTTWLVVVARRLCLDELRGRYGRPRGSKTPEVEDARVRRRLADLVAHDLDLHEVPDPAAVHPAEQLAMRHGLDRLHAALATLPEDDRLLLKLRYQDDLPAREIAALLHLPTPFHVYRRINALLALIRRALETAGVDDATG